MKTCDFRDECQSGPGEDAGERHSEGKKRRRETEAGSFQLECHCSFLPSKSSGTAAKRTSCDGHLPLLIGRREGGATAASWCSRQTPNQTRHGLSGHLRHGRRIVSPKITSCSHFGQAQIIQRSSPSAPFPVSLIFSQGRRQSRHSTLDKRRKDVGIRVDKVHLPPPRIRPSTSPSAIAT